MHTQKTSTLKTVAWLLGSTRDLLPPLLLACVLACAHPSESRLVVSGLSCTRAPAGPWCRIHVACTG